MAQSENRVLEYPENYEEMVKKLQEREEEQVKKLMLKKKAASVEDLEKIANDALSRRQGRVSREHKSLKDLTIIRDSISEDVLQLKAKLEQEINELAQQVLNRLPHHPHLKEKLKGRIKPR